MLTKNFWKIFAGLVGRIQGETKEVTVTLPDNTQYTDTLFASSSRPYGLLGVLSTPLCNNYIGSWYGTWFGTGTTPPTIEDVTLEAPITDESIACKGSTQSLIVVTEPDCVRISAAHSLTNTTSKDITIKEVGCFGKINSEQGAFLLDRTVLNTPIVIPAGRTVPIEYAIKFPYGT